MMAESEKITILIVDDHALIREGLVSLIKGEPSIEVVGQAENGQEAVAKALELMPDLVLMDISLPDINGLDATVMIKRKAPEIKVLILSMYDNDEYVIQGLKCNISGYMLKKAMAQELISAIQIINKGEIYLYPSIATKLVNQMVRVQDKDPSERQDNLTERESEVIRYIARGNANKEIAELLNISERTVQTHRANVMKKLGCHSIVELVKYAIEKGLVEIERKC